jgi:hypothetical protein
MVHFVVGYVVLMLVLLAGVQLLGRAWPRWPSPAERAAQRARMLWELRATAVLGGVWLVAWFLTH